jgi:hypothetical protein
MYENVNLIPAKTARQRSEDNYNKNRNEEMKRIMDEILNRTNSGKKSLKIWVDYDSTIEKLLELGYTLSSTETTESYFKNNPGVGAVFGSSTDQITISW